MRHPLVSAVVIGLLHAAIVLAIGVQAAVDRQHLPRAWVLARPDTAASAAHGRYLRLHVVPALDAGLAPKLDTVNGRTFVRPAPVALEARNGRLHAHVAAASRVHLGYPGARQEGEAVLRPALELYVPPAAGSAPELSRQPEVWVEVSVPRQGPPRPLRLGTMKDGRIVPIGLGPRTDD
jgi:hypothetical protein